MANKPVMRKDFATFSEEVRMQEADAHHGFCRVGKCVRMIHSFHHRLPNTVPNRRKYPLFIQSLFNCAGVCEAHHTNNAAVDGLNISDREAWAYETYLRSMIKNGLA